MYMNVTVITWAYISGNIAPMLQLRNMYHFWHSKTHPNLQSAVVPIYIRNNG